MNSLLKKPFFFFWCTKWTEVSHCPECTVLSLQDVEWANASSVSCSCWSWKMWFSEVVEELGAAPGPLLTLLSSGCSSPILYVTPHTLQKNLHKDHYPQKLIFSWEQIREVEKTWEKCMWFLIYFPTYWWRRNAHNLITSWWSLHDSPCISAPQTQFHLPCTPHEWPSLNLSFVLNISH